MSNKLNFVIASAFTVITATTAISCEKATLVLKADKIYTADNFAPYAKAVVTLDDKIIYVGDREGAKKYECGGASIIDLKGKFIYPGFSDAHQHLKAVGYREKTLNLQNINSLKTMLETIDLYAKSNPTASWIVGRGWIEKIWPEKRFPTRYDLDKIDNKRPIFITRADGHSAVVNTAALRLAGIDKMTKSPSGGSIMRDEDGIATGMLIDRAMGLVRNIIPRNSLADDEDALRKALIRNAALGWTQTQEAGGTYSDIDLLKKIHREGQLHHRIYYAMQFGPDSARLLKDGAEISSDNMINIKGIKIVLDGALGSRGALLLHNYSDFDTKGLLMHQKETIMPILIDALKKDIQIETHAIGDGANRLILDWYEEAFNHVSYGRGRSYDPRWRIEHAQNIHPTDKGRFKELGIIPSMQPSHAIGDLHFAADRLGEDRLGNAYIWKYFLDQDVIIAAGTDAPVEIGDPRIEFYAAVARTDLKTGFSEKYWHLEYAVSRSQALKMLTIWPAYAAFQDKIRGSIKVGKLADFSILSKDIMTLPKDKIMTSENIMTIVNGKITYKK
jgi:predicted amidohydrolase YtcJ